MKNTITITINEQERRMIENAIVKYASDKSDVVKRDALDLLASIGRQANISKQTCSEEPELDAMIDTVGTGFHGCKFEATRTELEMMFGTPKHGPTQDGKVNFCWHFRLPNGRPATLYDYRTDIAKDKPDEPINWHIGAKSKTDAVTLLDWLVETIGWLRRWINQRHHLENSEFPNYLDLPYMNNEITQTQDSKGEDKLESIIALIKTIQDHWYDEAKKNRYSI